MTAKMLILSRFIQYWSRKTFLRWSEPNQYSKWRPAAILDFQKVQISVIFHFYLIAADDNMIFGVILTCIFIIWCCSKIECMLFIIKKQNGGWRPYWKMGIFQIYAISAWNDCKNVNLKQVYTKLILWNIFKIKWT